MKLHDELNRDLRAICPAPDYIGQASPVKARQSRHMRFKSADEVTLESPARKPNFQIWQNRRSLDFDRSAESDPLGLGCSPRTAAEIAKCFLAKVRDTRQRLLFADRTRFVGFQYTKNMAPDAISSISTLTSLRKHYHSVRFTTELSKRCMVLSTLSQGAKHIAEEPSA